MLMGLRWRLSSLGEGHDCGSHGDDRGCHTVGRAEVLSAPVHCCFFTVVFESNFSALSIGAPIIDHLGLLKLQGDAGHFETQSLTAEASRDIVQVVEGSAARYSLDITGLELCDSSFSFLIKILVERDPPVAWVI